MSLKKIRRSLVSKIPVRIECVHNGRHTLVRNSKPNSVHYYFVKPGENYLTARFDYVAGKLYVRIYGDRPEVIYEFRGDYSLPLIVDDLELMQYISTYLHTRGLPDCYVWRKEECK